MRIKSFKKGIRSNSDKMLKVKNIMNLFKNTNSRKEKALYDILEKHFNIYKTYNLKEISPEKFREYLESKINTIDSQIEGYDSDEVAYQRDLSIKFHWGHNHDFGSFKLSGRMKDRHIKLLVNFISLFPITLNDIKNKYIFDIGCWTGGTTLLLAALSNKVFAIEEVKKYAEVVSFLSESFDVNDRVSVKPYSIYQCNSESFYDQFDIVFFPGVIYHLSDPLIALRILFNSLKIGGIILVESGGLKRKEPYCKFAGSHINTRGKKKNINRGGWNWFIPTPTALHRMMKEAGFDEIKTVWHDNRIYGFGRKSAQVGICKSGLSFPNIR